MHCKSPKVHWTCFPFSQFGWLVGYTVGWFVVVHGFYMDFRFFLRKQTFHLYIATTVHVGFTYRPSRPWVVARLREFSEQSLANSVALAISFVDFVSWRFCWFCFVSWCFLAVFVLGEEVLDVFVGFVVGRGEWKKVVLFFKRIQVKIPYIKRGGFTVNHRYFVESVWKKTFCHRGFKVESTRRLSR